MVDIGSRKVFKNLNLKDILFKLNELQVLIYKNNIKDVTDKWLLRHSDCFVINCDDYKGVSDSSDSDVDQDFMEKLA